VARRNDPLSTSRSPKPDTGQSGNGSRGQPRRLLQNGEACGYLRSHAAQLHSGDGREASGQRHISKGRGRDRAVRERGRGCRRIAAKHARVAESGLLGRRAIPSSKCWREDIQFKGFPGSYACSRRAWDSMLVLIGAPPATPLRLQTNSLWIRAASIPGSAHGPGPGRWCGRGPDSLKPSVPWRPRQ